MNLICLDIDGVLNNHRYGRTVQNPRGAQKLDPHNVACLDALCRAVDGKILVTSSWRGHGAKKLDRWLQERGLGPNRVLDVLPTNFPNAWIDWQAAGQRSSFFRGLEIEAWLLQQTVAPLRDIRVVILDDDSDFGRLLPYWVRTTMFEGPETLDPVKYRYTGPYSGLQAGHVGQATLLLVEQGMNPAGALVLDEPNPLWTPKAREALF